MKLISLTDLLATAKTEADFMPKFSAVQAELREAIANGENLTDCAIWLKGSIDTINSIDDGGKLLFYGGRRAYKLEVFKDFYQECLDHVQKLLLADPSKI